MIIKTFFRGLFITNNISFDIDSDGYVKLKFLEFGHQIISYIDIDEIESIIEDEDYTPKNQLNLF